MNDVVCKHGWSLRFCEPCSYAHFIAQLKGPRHMDMLAMKPENVPEAVWRAAMSTYHKTLRKNPAMAWQEAVVAALGAWPHMIDAPEDFDRWRLNCHCIILPLPQEKPDDKA